jgi:hypothetical protein
MYGIAICWLAIYVDVLQYFRASDNPSGFGYPRVSVSGMDFHPNEGSGRIWVLGSGFGLGAQRLHPIRIRPVAIPSALGSLCCVLWTLQ